jgi:uncharacterized protein with GYD domain
MGHYLFRASYTMDGLQGLLSEGAAARKKVIDDLFVSLGGKLDHMYWTFGDADVVVFGDLPDDATAAAFSTRISASGAASVATTILLTASDVDRAREIQVSYRPPGA